MSLFSKAKAVLWPKALTTELYLDLSENNVFPVDVNLWKPCTEAELQSLNLLFSQYKVETCTILVPDDVVFTKSFIYDSEISSIEKGEVIGLAESFVHFKIHPDYIDYQLIPSSGKTIILAHIFDRSKIDALKNNLGLLKLKSFSFESVSQAIAKVISLKYAQEYFLLYPLNQNEYTLLLAKKDVVYLTANLKGPSLDVQKIINYSNLYFSAPISKLYVPGDVNLEINASTNLDKTPYTLAQIAMEFKKSPSLPLPVLGLVISSEATPAIINTTDTSSTPPKSMENKKSILPFVLVFLVTAALASVIIWFVLNKNNNTSIENPVISQAPTPTIVEAPTETPTPVAEISKKLKLQVLNATDINGQAALLKTKLTQLGFTSVAVGNSTKKLTANEIHLKASLSSDSAYFQSQLAGFFDAVPASDLPATSSYDVVFSIGTDLRGTSDDTTPTATAAATPTTSP